MSIPCMRSLSYNLFCGIKLHVNETVNLCRDYVYMYLVIPQKLSGSEVMSCIKGKVA